MISKFFSSSKPIHLVIVTIFIFVVFSLIKLLQHDAELDVKSIGIDLFMFGVIFMSISILAFFVTKNSLTQRNSYKILFYVLLLAIVPMALEENKILMANLFIILALRRIFSLRNNLRVKKKLFDAAFWITIAALFYFWSILFFALIFAALLLFSNDQIKNWIIPITGFLCVLIILLCYFILTTGNISDALWFIQPLDFDFSDYNALKFVTGITIILSLGLWATFFYIKGISDKPKQFRSSHLLILYTTLLALVIILIAPNKNGSEFVFLLTPLAIIMANFIEGLSERWFSEVFIWLLIVTPLIKLFL